MAEENKKSAGQIIAEMAKDIKELKATNEKLVRAQSTLREQIVNHRGALFVLLSEVVERKVEELQFMSGPNNEVLGDEDYYAQVVEFIGKIGGLQGVVDPEAYINLYNLDPRTGEVVDKNRPSIGG